MVARHKEPLSINFTDMEGKGSGEADSVLDVKHILVEFIHFWCN